MYIVGGRILTMAGREIPEGILQIRNGKIAQVGARGEVTAGRRRAGSDRKKCADHAGHH